MLMPNDQSRSVAAAAATAAAAVAAWVNASWMQACPGTRVTVILKQLLLLLHVAIWCSLTDHNYNVV